MGGTQRARNAPSRHCGPSGRQGKAEEGERQSLEQLQSFWGSSKGVIGWLSERMEASGEVAGAEAAVAGKAWGAGAGRMRMFGESGAWPGLLPRH